MLGRPVRRSIADRISVECAGKCCASSWYRFGPESELWVQAEQGPAHLSRYVRRPFQREPDFWVESAGCNLRELLARGTDKS